MTTYNEYVSKQHIEHVKKDPNYIKQIPADELNYDICVAAVKKAAGDCDFFKWFIQTYPQFVDENLCKIAVDANPKKEYVRSEESGYAYPDGTVDWDSIYKYFDPVIKYIPIKFRTVDVIRTSLKHDWRTLEFVPLEMQVLYPDICETAVNKCEDVMRDDDEFYDHPGKRKKRVFELLNKSVFEQHPNILDGKYTLQYVSKKWVSENPEKIGQILLNQPEQIKLLPKDFRKKHIDVIRAVAGEKPEILKYLSAKEQSALIDLCEKALKDGSLWLSCFKPQTQKLMEQTCVEKLTKDPHETQWLCISWADKPTPGLNLMGLCAELQNKNPELISKLVCETPELLEYVKPVVLITHPEICVAAIEKHGASILKKIPKSVLKKRPSLYKTILKKCPGILPDLPKEFQTRENWIEAIKGAPWLIKVAPAEFMTVEHYKNAFLQCDSTQLLLSQVPQSFRTYEICKIAVGKYAWNLEYVPDNIKSAHPDVCEIAIEQEPRTIHEIPEIIQLQNPNLCKLAVSSDPKGAMEYIKPSVQRKYPEICRLALAQYLCENRPFWNKKEEDKAKQTIYSAIAPDVLKQNWDYINDTGSVITVAKCFMGRYR